MIKADVATLGNIPFFSEIVLPLQRLMKKGVEFIWTAECTAAYVLMKDLFKEKISLYIPNPSLPYVVHTDASNFASSSVLHQRVDGGLLPITFHSEAFTGSKLGQHILQKELYALVDAVKRFEFYLVGTSFEVFTKSRVLLYLRKAKDSNPKLYRWSLILQGHEFTITHVISARNLVADMLSRTTNEKDQQKARQLSMTKKDLLDRYKRETEQCFIPEGPSMSSDQVVQLLQEPYLSVNLWTPSWTREDMVRILLDNMEDKEEVAERLYAEGGAKLPLIESDFVCKIISCRVESDPEVESEIPGLALASYQAMGISLLSFANLQQGDEYCQEIRSTMTNKGMKWLFAEVDGILVRLPPTIHSKKRLKARLTPNTPRAVVPDVLIDLLIDRTHCGPSRAHVGPSRLLATLTKKYFFRAMKENYPR